MAATPALLNPRRRRAAWSSFEFQSDDDPVRGRRRGATTAPLPSSPSPSASADSRYGRSCRGGLVAGCCARQSDYRHASAKFPSVTTASIRAGIQRGAGGELPQDRSRVPFVARVASRSRGTDNSQGNAHRRVDSRGGGDSPRGLIRPSRNPRPAPSIVRIERREPSLYVYEPRAIGGAFQRSPIEISGESARTSTAATPRPRLISRDRFPSRETRNSRNGLSSLARALRPRAPGRVYTSRFSHENFPSRSASSFTLSLSLRARGGRQGGCPSRAKSRLATRVCRRMRSFGIYRAPANIREYPAADDTATVYGGACRERV